MESEALERVDQFPRQILKELYDQCTEEQQGFFRRMYVSLEEIPDEKVRWAIQQCERTIEKNKKE